ncbi:UDP-glucose 4-epimerase family protein [Aliivibrio sifiae]|uniref:UDP-glucose 4-epimerase n=1 Tax=Aliivibrio sifiae TaxID=566293 RepID=A0A2S7X0K7_9GAMM|nr:SDR family oxidoreductase [Aliivibrio sifiae]PQJ83353.1 UDP-glucose 4-epimerase [Aliivibrio sifiae]
MNLLVTGASGFIGSKLLERLNLSLVKALGRNLPVNLPCSQFYKQDIGNSTNYSKVLCNIDTIIHIAARVHIMSDESSTPLNDYREVNTEGTLNLARQAIAAGVKRFIFISSIKVNGEATELDCPFKSEDIRSPKDFYGQSKSEAEEQLLQLSKETSLEVVIIRPTLVYGPGVKANFASLLNLVSKGLPLPFGCITNNKRSLVSVNNLVDLIVTCIGHPKAVNQVFLVSDDHDVSTSEMVREMAKSLNKPQWQLPIPKWCYRLAGSIFGKQDVVDRLLSSLQVDITHTKETLDWKPPQTLEEGFKETAEAFLLNKENKQ